MATVSRPREGIGSGAGRSIRLGLLSLLFLFLAGCGQPASLELGFAGDIMPDRGVKAVIQRDGLPSLFRTLPAIFGSTDLVCANLETAATGKGRALIKTFRFNAPPQIGNYLAKYRIQAIGLANNHSIDYGSAGLIDTESNLRRHGVTPFGSGPGQRSALQPTIMSRRGIRVAFLGAVCFPLEGYAYLPDRHDVARWDGDLIKEGIASARQKADLVVVSLHWGIEFSPYPTNTQAKMAHFCLDAGADIVVGHHPHVLQAMELYQGKPIFYSLGNFLFDQQYGPARESIFVKTVFKEGRLASLEIIPLVLRDCRPETARGKVAAKILERVLGGLRRDGKGGTVAIKNERAVVTLSPSQVENSRCYLEAVHGCGAIGGLCAHDMCQSGRSAVSSPQRSTCIRRLTSATGKSRLNR